MNITPQKQAKQYYINVKDSHCIYVWGMDFCTIITQETIDKAYKDNHTSKYNRKYYDDKLKEGQGKPGSDCSGMHHDLSGYDTNAQGYYNRCTGKGPFSTLPTRSLVLLFKGSSSQNITHTGIYLGNGQCLHLKNSKENCVYEPVDNHNWSAWGYGDFISYDEPLDAKPIITRIIKIGSKGVDVKLLQEQLNNKSYDCGKVDGDFGSKTEKAVKTFQNDNNLKVDGIVNKATAKKLGMLWRGPSY